MENFQKDKIITGAIESVQPNLILLRINQRGKELYRTSPNLESYDFKFKRTMQFCQAFFFERQLFDFREMYYNMSAGSTSTMTFAPPEYLSVFNESSPTFIQALRKREAFPFRMVCQR